MQGNSPILACLAVQLLYLAIYVSSVKVEQVTSSTSVNILNEAERRAAKVGPTKQFPTARELVRSIATNSNWWRERIPPQRPGGWVNFYDTRNIRTTLVNLTVGSAHKDKPVEESEEVYRVFNCTGQERSIDQELTIRTQSVVGATISSSFTQENELNFNIGTNPNVATFLAANVTLGSKVTINLTSQQSKQETDERERKWRETRSVPAYTLLVILAQKSFGFSYLPFEANVLIDAEVYLEWFNPEGAFATRNQKRWRPLTLFAPTPNNRMKKVKGTIYKATILKLTDFFGGMRGRT
jgi:hypothetical protein